ncbi:MAG: two-component regulator propeller domain-containing protein [Bacteroidota bacterium]
MTLNKSGGLLRVVCLVVLLSLVFQSVAQTYYGRTRSIGLEEGLSHYKVLSFLPEEDGMWIGTEDGLNFFNGYNWEYWPGEKGTPTEKNISFLQKDQLGFLWLFHARDFKDRSTITSIDLITPDRDSIFQLRTDTPFALPFLPREIQHFFADDDNRLFFLVNNQLWRYSKAEQFQTIPVADRFLPHAVLPNGNYIGRLSEKLVVVTPNGVVQQTLDYPLQNCAYDFLGDESQFWIFQLDGPCRTYRRNAENSEYQSEEVRLPELSYAFPALLCYNAGRQEVWIKNGQNMYLLDADQNVLYHYPKAARQVVQDGYGNYWLGKNQMDVLQLQPERFKRLLWNEHGEGVNRTRCRGIIESDGELYVGTYRGVRRLSLENGSVATLVSFDTLGFCFLKDRQGQLWLGRRDVTQLDSTESKVAKIYTANKTRIWSMFEDQNGLIWIGTQRGLSYLKDGQVHDFVQYNGHNALRDALVLFFYEDRAGSVWVGSTGGLFQLDPKRGILASYGKDQMGDKYLPAGQFQHLYQDGDGTYWLATKEAGLLHWDKDNQVLQQYGQSYGLPSDNIYSVYEDDYGFLWMSTFSGIVRFDKKTRGFQVFYEEDGICENEFNRISHFQADDGYLYFGSQNGVTAFHPRHFLADTLNDSAFGFTLKHVSVVGDVIWNDYWHDGEPIDLEHLPPDTKIIDLEIEGTNMFWASQVNLPYVLRRISVKDTTIVREGEDPGSGIELLDLQPGIYELQVWARQKNGKQIGQDFIVPIRIRPPIYYHPLFWLVALVVLAFSIWTFTRWRTAHLRRQKVKLQALVEQRTREVLAQQQTISNQAELIENMRSLLDQQDEKLLQQFQQIVEQRLADPTLYLPDIIEEMSISRTVFYEKVKQLTNMTPNQYIVELRLTKAKSLLDQKQALSVKEVAQAVGIKDPKYFSRRFKERFGVLPSTYFKQIRN